MQTPHSYPAADPAPSDAPLHRETPEIADALLPDKAPLLGDALPAAPREFGGPEGLEPTRYGDWERRGRCVDF